MTEIINNKQTLDSIAACRSRKEKIVFTNGCFDILHVGHVAYLNTAKALGNVLVIGLNSDESVKKIKGNGRPIVPASERKEMLLALRAVDFVCLFSEDNPLNLIKEIRPDLLVKGGDWPVDKIVGSDFVLSIGGEVRSLPFLQGHSTTDIVERIKKCQSG